MKRYLLLLMLLLGLVMVRGQQGSLDATFSSDGLATLHYFSSGNTNSERISKVLAQPDGKYIVLIDAGNQLLVRYNADGTVDQSFGSGGYAPAGISAYTAALQPDGKILIAGEWFNYTLGQWQFAVSRFSSNGVPDAGFGVGGVAGTGFSPYSWAIASALVVQDDGKIVAVGNGRYYDGSLERYAWLAARFTSSGALDPTFNSGGSVPGTTVFEFADWNEVRSVALQSDDKIVVGGHTYNLTLSQQVFTLARLLNDGTNDGTLDATFGTGGWVTTGYSAYAYLTSMALQPDGKIVAAGYAYVDDGTGSRTPDLTLARYGSDGTLDATFGTGGWVTTNLGAYEYAFDLALGPESIVVAGTREADDGTGNWYNDIVLARYLNDGTSDGTLDASFNPGGAVPGTLVSGLAENDYVYSVAVLSGGGIVVAGAVYNSAAQNDDYLLARYTSAGGLDNTFNATGTPAGMVVAFYAEGTWSEITTLAVQPDGKVVVAGQGDKYDPGSGNYYPVMGVARFNTDGTLDGSFGTNGVAYADFVQGTPNRYLSTRSVALAPDGKIIVGGEIEYYDGSQWLYDFALARFTSTGLPDETFDGDGMVTSTWNPEDRFSALAVQSDGKIVAVGASYIPSAIDQPDFFVARYNDDGTLDNSFGTAGVVSTDFFGHGDYAVDVAIQSDGKIVVSGGVENYDAGSGNYFYNFGVARYTSAGVLDNRFGTGGKAIAGNVYASGGAYLALQSDGKILVGGIYENRETYDQEFALLRFTSRGTLDGTFGTGGLATANFGVQETYPDLIALQSDGKILQAGTYWFYDEGSGQWINNFAIARYTSAGVLDNTFDSDGKMTYLLGPSTYVYDIAWQNGRLYAGGETYPLNEEGAGYLVAFIAGETVQPLPVVSIEDAVVTEGNTAAVTVRINTADHPDLTLSYATQDGTASSKGKTPDYKSARGSVTIANGSDVATISIPTNPDAVAEPGGETFTVNLNVKGRAATQVTIEDGSATVTINDPEGLVNKAVTLQELPEGRLAITAFPNPAPGYFTLQLQGGTNVPATVKVTDFLGRVVETRTGVAANSTLQLGNNYRPGIYYLHVQQGTEKQTLKLVKQAP